MQLKENKKQEKYIIVYIIYIIRHIIYSLIYLYKCCQVVPSNF